MKQKLCLAVLCCAAAFPFTTFADEPMEMTIVTPTRMPQQLDQTIADTTIIDEQEIRDSGATDVPTLLQTLAGIEFSQSGGLGKQSSLYMRGTNSNQVLVLLDGVRINSATTGATAIDQLVLDQVERIEVVRGNASSLYGSEAIGGVIQIFTRKGKGVPSANISGGVGSHDTQRLTAGYGGESEDTSYNLQVSKDKTAGETAINPAIVPTVNPDKDGYDNTSLSGNVRHAFNAGNTLAASIFRSRGDVQYDNAFGAATDQDTARSTISKYSLTSDNRPGEEWSSKLQLTQGEDDYRSYFNGAQTYYVSTTNRQVGWQNTLAVNTSGNVLLGLENLEQHVASDTAYVQTSRTVNSLLAGYAGNYSVHQVQANIRQDRYSDFGVANTGLLGYGLVFADGWRATASVSNAFKAPTFNDMYWPSAWGYQGNPDLKPERSRNLEFGLHYEASGQHASLVYFDNRIHDMIDPGITTPVNVNRAQINGLELTASGQAGDTGLKLALTLQNPRDALTGQKLLHRAKYFANLYLSHQYQEWRGAVEWRLSGARADNFTAPSTFVTTREKLGGYGLVNVSAHYRINKETRLSLSADNVFDKNYMLVYGYNTPGRAFFASIDYQQ